GIAFSHYAAFVGSVFGSGIAVPPDEPGSRDDADCKGNGDQDLHEQRQVVPKVIRRLHDEALWFDCKFSPAWSQAGLAPRPSRVCSLLRLGFKVLRSWPIPPIRGGIMSRFGSPAVPENVRAVGPIRVGPPPPQFFRRRLSRDSAQGLEILGHAIEYLADEDAVAPANKE